MKRAYERLICYTAFETASDEASTAYPSTEGQLVLGAALVVELKALGIADARLNEYGYVYATIPANIPMWQGKRLGLCAHMDTVADPSAVGVKPRIIADYDGGDYLPKREAWHLYENCPTTQCLEVLPAAASSLLTAPQF